MNTYKNIFCACNGTRIAQCSLLIALAFLCLAIVFLCVFYNLNALATNNIAFAEEPVRNAGNNGYAYNNYLTNNYCVDWSYSLSGTSNSINSATIIYEDDYFIYKLGNGSLNNNVLSFGCYFFVYLKQSVSRTANFWQFAVGFTESAQYCYLYFYNSSTSSSYNLLNNYSNASTNYLFWSSSSTVPQTISSGSYFYFYFGTERHLTFLMLTESTGGVFSGYVSPDYHNYGYNQGVADAGGGSADPVPDYSIISSNGIVRDNLVDNNDWLNADYNVSVSSGSNIFFDGTNFDNELICESGVASIIGNTYSNDGHSCQLDFNVKDFDTPLISSNIYIFTIYLSHFNNRADLYLTCYCDSFTNYIEIPHTSSDGFYSLLIDLSEYSNISFNDFYIELEMRAGGSVDISWFKLEEGSSFSGYVPKSYKMYGYNDGVSAGRNVGYQEGYQDGYDSASLESFNRIGDLENMSFTQNYVVGDKTLMCYAVEEDSFTYDGTRYEYQYYETQGEEEVYNGLVIDYNFSYKVRIITQFFGSVARWNEVGFKILIIDSSNHNSYFFVTRDDTQYITFLSTWTNVGNAFGDIYNVQIDIPLPDNTKYYNIAFVPINWNYHDINAESRSLRASSYQDTSSMLIWDNTQLFGLTNQSNYANIVEDRVHEAWSDGHYQGIQEGRSQGESTGYTIGYNAGVNAAGDYTFYSLLGAVFDTPISTLRGLLNFNILGVNLYDFVIALLSLAIVLFVFRIFVRGL